MNHKKKRPISRRAHCKMCKGWKINGVRTESLAGEKYSDHVRRLISVDKQEDSHALL